MIVLGKQINIKSIARVLIVVLASSWFIPISCTSLLFGLFEEPMMMGGGGLVADDFDSNHPDSKHFTIVAESKDSDEAFVTVPYSNLKQYQDYFFIKTSHSLNFLMSKSEGSKNEKPIKLEEDGDRYVYSSVSYEVIEQDTQGQIIKVVKKVELPHSYSIYKSRYKVANNNITPISFKSYFDSIGASANMMSTFLIAIFIYFISKLFLYLFFTKNENTKSENIKTNNASKYYWKGIVDGENQEGEILAKSKEDAIKQLRDKKVIITQLKLADDQRQDNTKPEKQKNTETNKIRLFIKRARSVKVAFWIYIFTLILIGYSFNFSSMSILLAFVIVIFLQIAIWLITQPYMLLSDNKKSTFERFLYMFFWVVSISVILAAIIVPRHYMGWIVKAKINASKENHARVSDMLSTSFTKCSTGALETFTLKSDKLGGTTSHACSNTTDKLVEAFVLHLQLDGWKNPHDAKQYCCAKSSSNPPFLGAPNTHIYAISDTEITIKTNIGTKDSDNKWLTSTVLKK